MRAMRCYAHLVYAVDRVHVVEGTVPEGVWGYWSTLCTI